MCLYIIFFLYILNIFSLLYNLINFIDCYFLFKKLLNIFDVKDIDLKKMII